MTFIATIHQPGFLPDGDPEEFDTAIEAWQFLSEERQQFEMNDQGSEHDDPVVVYGYADLPAFTQAVDALNLLADDTTDSQQVRIENVMRVWLASSSDFTAHVNIDGTGELIAPSTLDPESHKLPFVYTVVTAEEIH